jgi:hypothetical protein
LSSKVHRKNLLMPSAAGIPSSSSSMQR